MTDASEPLLESRKRLWVVTELYRPELTSTGYYLTAIAEGLAPYFNVGVICGQPNYAARGLVAPSKEILNNVEVRRVRGTRLNKNVLALKLLNMLTLGIAVLMEALVRFAKGDQVLVVTTPPNLPFIAAIAALIKRSSYTLLIHDNYPEAIVAVGKARNGSFLVKTMQFLNRWLYKHAARIIVVGRDMEELVRSKTEGLDTAITVIPNWAELETVDVRPREETRLLKQLGVEDRFVFLYAGNLGLPNDVESIIEAACLLRNENAIHFIFLGGGVKRKWIGDRLKEHELENVTLLEPRPRADQIDFLNACDVGIVSLIKGMWGVSMPSRTYNLMAAGKPILAITEQNSELDRVVRENENGWTVEPNDPISLAAVIKKIVMDRSRLFEMTARSRDAAETQYNVERAISKYRAALAVAK